MGLSQHGFLILGYTLAVLVLVCQAAYALWCAYRFRAKNRSTETFVTARHMVGTFRLGWAFYATSIGGWIMVSPAQYSPYAGFIGAFMYAFGQAITVPVTALAGLFVRRKLAHPWSLADFVSWRFGWLAQTYITLYIGVNLSICMLGEYTVASAMLGSLLGSVGYPICIVLFLLTTTYTLFGGLVVSIFTDQIQGISSIVLLLTCAFYMAAKFRPTLPTPIPCNSPDDPMGFCISGTNSIGYSSIFTQPASLVSICMLYETYWQRNWAANSERTLIMGSLLGGLFSFMAILFTGLAGLFAAWGGYITADTNPNLYFLYALPGAVNDQGLIGNAMGLVVIVLTVTMNMGAIDSFQNGMAAAFSAYFLKKWKNSLKFTRLFVFLANIPLVVLATKNYSLLQMFLLIQMLATCSAFQFVMGIFEPLYPYMGGGNFILSSMGSMLFTSVYGCNRFWNDNNSQGSFNEAMRYTWMENLYEWQFFAVSIGSALGCSFVMIAFTYLWKKLGLRKLAIPGFTAPATHPEAFPDADVHCAPGDKEKQDSTGSAGSDDGAVTTAPVITIADEK